VTLGDCAKRTSKADRKPFQKKGKIHTRHTKQQYANGRTNPEQKRYLNLRGKNLLRSYSSWQVREGCCSAKKEDSTLCKTLKTSFFLSEPKL
jgi:hypothetical protein